MNNKINIGIASYREDQWGLLKSTASDPEVIENTYQEWLENTGRVIEDLKKNDYEPVKVDFDVKRFNDWCQINNKTPNGESRSEYVGHLLRIKNIFSHN
ncbi:MAG: hypothetical protein HZA08_10205 [Nitrospirae bacterium]|nr:hypothetical protein [Nitrospirota bacterium]